MVTASAQNQLTIFWELVSPLHLEGVPVLSAVPYEKRLGKVGKRGDGEGVVRRDAEHTVDSMTLYDAWRKSGCMKGAFFGHDHTNTFDGMDRNGIRIGMTKSINCGGSYGDGDPGLRIFRIRTFGSLESWTETEITLRSVL